MTKTRAGSLIFLLVGGYALVLSTKFPLGQWNEPGAGVLPLSLSILLCISGMLWFIAGKPKEGEKTGIDWRAIAKLVKVPFQIVALTAALVLMLTRVGFLLGTMIYLFLIFAWVSRFKLRVAIGLAVVLGTGSWLFFVKLLLIQLPAMGVWIF
ncbi:MAG: Tripartite tricarboxylate transporter TctB family [Deltaproteobacteria bacterium]|nr:Tripartite tricarboxylate transporter TctB family [Deltaproteobacteria bacterium]